MENPSVNANRRPSRRQMLCWAVAVLIALNVGFLGLAGYGKYTEANRRELDAKSLQSLGLGIQGYERYKKAFPAGATLVAGQPPERGHSWMASILPYMEAVDVYQKIDFSKPWDDPANLSVSHTPYNYKIGSVPQSVETPYVGIAGVGRDAAALPLSDPNVGVFGYGRQTRLSDVTDGAARTIMVIETSEDRGAWMSGGNATVRGLDQARQPYLGAGRPFGHTGGAMALYVDGSVRWVGDSIDPKVFEALATIHGGETVPSEYQAPPPAR